VNNMLNSSWTALYGAKSVCSLCTGSWLIRLPSEAQEADFKGGGNGLWRAADVTDWTGAK
jgi:hypothetical protein